MTTNTGAPEPQKISLDWSYCGCQECKETDTPTGKSPQPAISELPTPYLIYCVQDGDIYISNHEFMRQLKIVGPWECPKCHAWATCDSKHFSDAIESTGGTQDA